MDPVEEPELLDATRALAVRVEQLSTHLSVSKDQAERTERQVKRTKRLTVLVAVAATLALLGVMLTGVALYKVRKVSRTNLNNAVTNCENANESRKANLALWTFVLDASLASNPEQTPQEAELSAKFREWVGQLYAQRDCDNLGKQYDLPDPPTLG